MARRTIEDILDNANEQIRKHLLRKAQHLFGENFPQMKVGLGEGFPEKPRFGSREYLFKQCGLEAENIIQRYMRDFFGTTTHVRGIKVAFDKHSEERVIFTPDGLYRCPLRFFFDPRSHQDARCENDVYIAVPIWNKRHENKSDYLKYGKRLDEYLLWRASLNGNTRITLEFVNKPIPEDVETIKC